MRNVIILKLAASTICLMILASATCAWAVIVDPTDIAGNVYWLAGDNITPQGDGTNLTGWTDASPALQGTASQGNANNQPKYIVSGPGGLPTVRFDDTVASQEDSLQLGNSLGLGNSSLHILNLIDLSDITQGGPFFKIGTATNGFALGIGSAGAGGNFDGSGSQLIGLFEVVRWIPTGTSLTAGTHLVELVLDGTGEPSIYLDGTLAGTFAGTNAVAPTSETNIGGYVTSTRYFSGDASELVVFSQLLTDGSSDPFDNELNDIRFYFQEKYGLALGLSATPQPVPEPSSFLLLGLSALNLVRHTRRRSRRA